jgi:hypothetical protein
MTGPARIPCHAAAGRRGGQIGVSTRATTTLFAMEHGLVAWGELPMARPVGRS